jgi:osmoprotectant transport system substrate-binding protein
MEPVGPGQRLAIPLLAFALVVGACGGGDAGQTTGAGDGVTVAAFGFSESRILAEVYAQAMEAKGIPVERAMELASREVVEPALEQGVVDFVPEYSGTALEFLNRAAGQATSDSEATYRLLRDAFASRGITTLQMAPAQDQNALAVTRATAERLRLTKVSDLRPVAQDLVLGAPPECPERRFCLAGLTAVYGLSFREFRPLDAGGPLTVGALEGNEVDVGVLFTTSPAIASSGLVLLADDRGLQPAENVVPVVRTPVLERHGDRLRDAVDAVSRRLTTEELVGLNRSVDVNSETPQQAARSWLARQGLDKS